VEDADLIEAIADRDARAFADFYRRYYLRVWRYAAARLGDRDLAATAAQETMWAAWRTPESYAGRGSPAAWLFGIARHKVADAFRARRKHPVPVPDDALERRVDEYGVDPAEGATARQDVLEALRRLSPEQREVVYLTFYAGLSYGEIAETVGVPPGTVKSRMYHARRRLGELLGE